MSSILERNLRTHVTEWNKYREADQVRSEEAKELMIKINAYLSRLGYQYNTKSMILFGCEYYKNLIEKILKNLIQKFESDFLAGTYKSDYSRDTFEKIKSCFDDLDMRPTQENFRKFDNGVIENWNELFKA